MHFNARFDDVTTVSQITNGEFGFTLLEAELESKCLGAVYGAECVLYAGLSLSDFGLAIRSGLWGFRGVTKGSLAVKSQLPVTLLTS